jgi:hypothetical protein
MRFSGVLRDQAGKPLTGAVDVHFAIYKDETDAAAIWEETQTLELDEHGRYTVLLGATQPEGLPLLLFESTEARWLGVAAGNLPEQPRVVLVSVPYALKASDAETLGGKPASAFVTTETFTNSSAQTQASGQGQTAIVGLPAEATSNPSTAVAGTGIMNFLPIWTNSTTLGNSTLFETGGKVGIGNTNPAGTLDVSGGAFIRGALELPAARAATQTSGSSSNPLDLQALAFNSATLAAVPQLFRWQAEPLGNNTTSPSGKLSLLFAPAGMGPGVSISTSGPPVETGLSIASNGQLTFASGQTFPGTGTITGVTAGTDLTGGGSTGTVTLNLDTTKVPTLGAASNTFTGSLAATSFSGNGAGLTSLTPANLSAGTAGINISGNAATATTAATASSATTASNALSLGGVAAANYARLDIGNSFTGNQSVTGNVSATGSVSGGTASFNGALSATTGTFSGMLLAGGAALFATGTATASQGYSSGPMDLAASSYNSGTSAAVSQLFRWRAEPAGNNTASPSGTLNLLYLSGSGTPVETGLSIASNGQLSFASGQTFPGTGTGTVTSVGSGSGLTGGPITSSGTLSIASGGVSNSMLANPSLTVGAGTDLTGGGSVALGNSVTLNLDTTKVPTLGASSNTFTGSLTASAFTGSSGTFSGSNSSPIVSVTQSGSGTALMATGGATSVYGLTSSTTSGSTGVVGNEVATSGQVYGVYGATSSTTNGATGVDGMEGATTGVVFGVHGVTLSSTTGAAGVLGNEGATTGQVYAVAGEAASTTAAAAGVYGYEYATTGQVYGVAGSTSSTTNGAAGVYGTNSANSSYGELGTGVTLGSTTVPTGVSGSSGSGTGGYGVYGQGDNGVYGANSTNNSVGELGTSVSGSATGVYGYGSGYGVYGANSTNNSVGQLGTSVSGNAAGVYGYGSGYGVYGSSGAYGVLGYNTTNSSYGELGTTVSGFTVGAYGTSSYIGVEGAGSATGVFGYSPTYDSAGQLGSELVFGSTTYPTGVVGSGAYGVFGMGGPSSNISFSNATGVWGDTGNSSGFGVLGTTSGTTADGVRGVASDSSSIGVFGWNSSTTSGTGVYGVGTTYGVFAAGNLGVTGTKSAVVALPDNRVVELYAVESPENWFEDFGSGELREGVAQITLDPTFALTVNTGSSYHVFLTPKGDCEGLYVTNETAMGFQVRELRGGKSNIAFDYRIVAKRRGYESVRMDQLEADAETVQAIREQMRNRPAHRRLTLPKLAEAHRVAPALPKVGVPPAASARAIPKPPEPPKLMGPPEPPKPPALPKLPVPPRLPKVGVPPAAPALVAPKPVEPPKQPESPAPPKVGAGPTTRATATPKPTEAPKLPAPPEPAQK